jgi:hypothetical protein
MISADLTPWYCHPDELAALVRYLSDTGRLDHSDLNALVRVLETPWDWSLERTEMVARRVANDADVKPVELRRLA